VSRFLAIKEISQYLHVKKEKQDLFRIIDNSDGTGRLLYMLLNRREGKEDKREEKVERRG
jgi:hypothetical protein